MPFRILIADDDPNLCDLFRNAVLRLEPTWTAEVAGDGREALDMLCNRHFDVAVLDFAMPHLNGLEVLEAARRKGIQTDVVIVTGYGDVDLAVQAMKMGAREFLEKPFTPLDLIAAIRKVLEDHHPSLDAVAERLDAFLKDHAGESSLNLSGLCRRFHISPAYVHKLFHEYAGFSFRKRLSYHRVQKAKQLLASTDISLKLIAEQCGFKNQRRLTEAFRRLEGVNPRKYRENW